MPDRLHVGLCPAFKLIINFWCRVLNLIIQNAKTGAKALNLFRQVGTIRPDITSYIILYVEKIAKVELQTELLDSTMKRLLCQGQGFFSAARLTMTSFIVTRCY